jgi:putative membrane protein
MKPTRYTTTIISLLGASFITAAAFGEGYAGKMTEAEFNKANQEAGAKIGKIKVDTDALNATDQELFKEIAAGGTMQLEVSKVAFANAGNPEVKTIAKAEIDEQMGLSTKLKEIAAKKNLTVDPEPNAETKEAVKELSALKGEQADAAFLKKIGVEGHEKLKVVMTKVKDNAKDASLKEIAKDALPLIELHLAVARDQAAKTATGTAKE